MDWVGNSKSAYTCNGASNHSKHEREKDDYYATEPKAIDILLNEGKIAFNYKILEPACGEGHMSERLKYYGYNVISRDKENRGYGEVMDFFELDYWDGDIITNPPYKQAKEFVEHALEIVPEGRRVAMFLKLTFLEGKNRKKMFEKYPPRFLFVSSSRLQCAKNGEFEKYKKGTGTAIAYGWYIWEKGYKGDTVIKWIN